MRAFVLRGLALSLAAAALAACSFQIDEQDFAPSVDADTTDAPPAGIELTPSPLNVTENGTAELTVRATVQLETDVTVTLQADATLGLSETSVVVGPSQPMATVDVTALDDDDAVPGEAMVSASATGLGTAQVRVDIAEDDTLELDTDPDTVSMTEGTSSSVQVRLTARPPGDLTVTVASADVLVASVSPATLFFGAENWNVYQSVTVASNQDPDVEHESIGISFTATGVPTRTVQANVQDDDVLGIRASVGSVTITEQGAAGTIGVRLTQMPVGNVTVTAAPGSAGVQVTPSSLSFTPSDYMTDKTLSVTALMDDDTDGFSTTLTLSATDLPDLPVTVTVIDDDTQAITTDAPNPLVVGAGATTTFGARLAYRPASNIVASVTSTSTSVATVSPGTLTFTSTNWDMPQQVTVTGGVDDDVVTSSTVVRLSSGALVTDVATDVTDPDVQALTLAGEPATVAEGGTASFTVRLAYRPQATTTVAVASSNAAIGVSTSTLTFTPANFAMPQTVTLSAPADDDVIDEVSTITVSSAGLVTRAFDVTVDDQSMILIQPSVGSMSITEEAVGSTFTVTLSNPPVGSLTVNIGTSNASVTRSPTSLVFTSANYSSPQTVTVAAVHDDDTIVDASTLTLSATGAISATVDVTVADNDVQAIVEDAPATLDLIDPDVGSPAGVTFGVRLRWQPQGNTTVNLASLNTAVATVSPSSLTFSSSDWSTPKTVTVTAAGDANLTDATTTVRLTSSGLPMIDIAVAVDDQDVQVVQTNPASSLTVTEGSNTTLQVRLKYQPAATTTVTLASSNPDITVPATLSFTTADYGTYKNATVAAAVDSDQINDTATITLSNFDAPSNTTVGVTVTDNTIVETWGWPTFSSSTPGSISNAAVIAYRVNRPSTTITASTLDKYGISGTAGSDFKMAIYSDASNVPGTLIHSIDSRVTATGGFQEIDVANTAIATGAYWIAVRASPTMAVPASADGTTTTRCSRNITIASLDTAWPTTFGTATCATAPALNLYIVTYR
ncbi:MAG: hypothetical protein K8M05_18205 [Deltaproteobacteria bacterium]|nr:hypothetical protein [Kofleriaceae bacterium]